MFVRILTGLTYAWFVAILYFSSDGGMSVFDVLGLGYGWLMLAVAWLITFFVMRSRKVGFGTRRRVFVPFLLAFGGVLYWSESAIYLRLLASRDALGAYVSSAQRAHLNSKQRVRVGFFTVRETETFSDGTVRLITADCMFDECGLAYVPKGNPLVIGEDSYDHLSGKWWHWSRSW